MLSFPQLAPLLPAKEKFAVKRLELLQPVKLIVTVVVRLPPAEILPIKNGNAAGKVILGEQAVPEV